MKDEVKQLNIENCKGFERRGDRVMDTYLAVTVFEKAGQSPMWPTTAPQLESIRAWPDRYRTIHCWQTSAGHARPVGSEGDWPIPCPCFFLIGPVVSVEEITMDEATGCDVFREAIA